MKTLPISEANKRFASLIRDVEGGRKFLITRYGRPVAVMMSPKEYESLKETIAVTRDRRLMHEISAGLAILRGRKARRYTMKELRLLD
jgi:prevent-host-death family protein